MHVISLFLQEGISITPLVSKQGPYFKYLFFHHLFFSSSDSLNLQTFMLKGQEQNIHWSHWSRNTVSTNEVMIAQYVLLWEYRAWILGGHFGCVNSRPAARESQEAGFMQPRAHLILYLISVSGRISHLMTNVTSVHHRPGSTLVQLYIFCPLNTHRSIIHTLSYCPLIFMTTVIYKMTLSVNFTDNAFKIWKNLHMNL